MTEASGGPAPGSPVLPAIHDGNRPFWDGCLAGELRLQVCDACGHIRYPISEICPRCLSSTSHWAPMSGAGEIVSWIRFRHAYNPAWADRLPYNVVLVQLPEGPRLFGNVEPLDADDLAVGDAVRVVFTPAADGIAVPRWRLVRGGSGP
ncbi:MAG TPA: OB-fold domain-containing protein [Candidatus Limnocylindrales bacterium]|jgi:hypothetical protein